MAPSIDADLETIDRKHAQLARLSTDLNEALTLYHQVLGPGGLGGRGEGRGD